MSLTGQLDTVSLAGILQLLCDENKTGILKVSNDEESFQICYLEGSIIYAIESKKQARLGTSLIRDGVISQEEMGKNLVLAKKKRQSLGKILVESGLITRETLEQYIRKQVEEILFNALKWERGNFQYVDVQIKLSWMVVVKLNTLQLVVDATRRLDEYRQKQESRTPI